MDHEQMNGAQSPFDLQRDQARAVYSNALNDITDRVLQDFILPADQRSIALDIAQFTVFLMAIKISSYGNKVPDKRELMQAYRHLMRDIEREVPELLLTFVNQAMTAIASEEQANDG